MCSCFFASLQCATAVTIASGASSYLFAIFFPRSIRATASSAASRRRPPISSGLRSCPQTRVRSEERRASARGSHPRHPRSRLPLPAAAMQQSSTSAEAYDETPPVHGAALVRVEITLHSPLAACFSGRLHSIRPSPLIDAASGQAVVLPQRALIAVHRLSTAITGVPALLQLLALKPWTAGLIVLGLSWWLLYGMSAAMLPWWVLLAWGANGVAIRQLASAPSPWEPLSAERGDLGSDDDDGGGEGYRAAGGVHLISSSELRCAL